LASRRIDRGNHSRNSGARIFCPNLFSVDVADQRAVDHDANCCYQRSYEEAKKNGCREWNGDVYKAIIRLRATRNDIDVCVVDTDYGCGVIRAVAPNDANLLKSEYTRNQDITFQWFAENRARLLNLKSYDEFIEWL